MKALYFQEHGELEVVRFGDVPDPKLASGQVLMKVRACALNHLDIWVRRGWPGLKLAMPHWCGADVAGEIVEVGAGVSGWKKGDRVVVDPGINTLEDEFTRRGEDSLSPGYAILGEQVRGGAAEFLGYFRPKPPCHACGMGVRERCSSSPGQPCSLAHAYPSSEAARRRIRSRGWRRRGSEQHGHTDSQTGWGHGLRRLRE